MKTIRKRIKQRKTKKRQLGGSEKNVIVKHSSGAICILPIKWSRYIYTGPVFLTQRGDEIIEIYDKRVFMFILLDNKWYAMVSRYRHGYGLIFLLKNTFAKIQAYELPEFKITDGIIRNIGKVISVDNTAIFNELIKIKNKIY